MTLSSPKARLLFAFAASVAAISTAHAQPTSSPTPKPGMTDGQMINTANQIVGAQPSNKGGLIPMPADISQGMAKTGFSQQTQLVNNPNATPQGSTVQQATSTDAGAAAVGIGGPIISNSQTLSQYIDIAANTKASNAIANQVQAQTIGPAAPPPPQGPGYYTTDLATGISTFHPLPPPADYTAMDQYVANRLANPPQQIRDPFAQPPAPPIAPPPDTPAPPPVQMPQMPSGPNYPTYHPSPKAQSADTAAIAGAIGAAMGAAMAAGAAEAGQNAQSPDGAAVAAEAAGQAAAAAAAAIMAAGLGPQVTAILNQSMDGGCSSGACGAYLAHPYDTSQWQPMPMFTEGNGSITDGGANMTQVAQLLPIYKGYDPFATGNLVPWPGQMIVPTLYPPTGVSSAGIAFDPSLANFGLMPLYATSPTNGMTGPGLQPVLCGR